MPDATATIQTSLGEVEQYKEALILWGDGRRAFAAGDRPVRKEVGKATAAQPWALWYKDSKNLEPLEILEVLTNNNINPGILNTIVDFIIGDGLRAYREVIVDGKKTLQVVDLQREFPQIYDFMERSDINTVMRNAGTDGAYLGNGFLQAIHTRGGENGIKVAQLNHLDASTMRCEFMSAGKVNGFYYSPDWNLYKSFNAKDAAKSQVQRIQAFDQALFLPDTNPSIASVIQSKRYLPGHPYYSLPVWYGAFNWIRLANEIPVWHLNGIQNGYHIKYRVEINEAVLASAGSSAADKEALKQKIRSEMDTYLAGGENAQKTFINWVPSAMWEKGLIRITPVGGDLNDEAFTALFEQSNMAMTSAHGLDPTLAGVETAGKLSSGSEKRIAYEIYLSLKTKGPRELLLTPWQKVCKVNGYDPTLRWGFENTKITTLDQNPTGSQAVIA